MELTAVPDRAAAKSALAATVLAASVAFAASTPRGDPPYVSVDNLVTRGLHENNLLRVRGYVEAGSIEHTNHDDHSFTLMRHGIGLRVHVKAPLPDTFRDQSEVIVLGRLVDHDGWSLEGTEVLAKCPTRYEGPPRKLDTLYK